MTIGAPVSLEIYYSGKKVRRAMSIGNGRYYVPEPQSGPVTFELKRTDVLGKERYACVLKVNGVNTNGKQRLPALQCQKWVLEPCVNSILIKGFQINDSEAEEFVISSPAASKANELNYGADVGTIQLFVFRESPNMAIKRSSQEIDEDEAIGLISRGELPQEPSPNIGALRARLQALDMKGVIQNGVTRVPSGFSKVRFRPYPTPVMAATIVYDLRQQ